MQSSKIDRFNFRHSHWLLAALAMFALPACTTIIIDETSRHEIVSVGGTRLVVPERSGDLVAFKRSGFGVGYGDAVG